MAPAEISCHDSSVLIKLIHRVRSKKRTINGKNFQFRVKAVLQSTERKLLLDLEKTSKILLTKWTKENGGDNEYVAVGKPESGCNDDDILSLNDFFEKLSNS